MRYLIFLLPILFLMACQEEKHPLIVVPEQLALRDTAGQKSKEILFLKKGTPLEDLGTVSNFETIIQLQGRILQSPWIKVQTEQHKQGWVLAVLLSPSDKDPNKWLETKRLECYFGKALTTRHAQWIETGPLNTENDMASYYREGIALRDTFMTVLAKRAEPNETTMQPDYSWLQNIFPGFIAQQLGSLQYPYLFADYNVWRQKAVQSSGEQDDEFFDLCLKIFPKDGVESFFPAWKFQLDDLSSASQLGSGAHFDILNSLEERYPAAELFQAERTVYKDLIFEDIAGKDIGYWQPEEKILAELKKITEANFSCINDRDRLVLQTRFGMFEDPVANGIRVNLRSGM